MMDDWHSQLKDVKRTIKEQRTVRMQLPAYFNFKDHGAFDFDKALQVSTGSFEIAQLRLISRRVDPPTIKHLLSWSSIHGI